MDQKKIMTEVKIIIGEVTNISNEEALKLSDDAELIDDCDIDSLERVELIIEIEKKYNMQISDDDSESLTTIKSITDYIIKNTSHV